MNGPRLLLFLALLAPLPAAEPAKSGLAAGDHLRSLSHQDRERSYRVHVPAGLDPAKPVPVVLAFHGGASDAESMARFSGLDAKADAAGFVAVYPNGTGRLKRVLTWNAGTCCGYAVQEKVDDVGFTAALLDDLAKVLPVDRKRVFATGMSNGGMLCHRLAAELPDRIAAVASVSGPLGIEAPAPSRPVSVLHVHGTDDAFAPYDGGTGDRSLSGCRFTSAPDSVRAWASALGCPGTPVRTELPDAKDDGMRSERHVFGPGRGGAEAVLVTVHGGGHAWPGHPPRLRSLGPCTGDFDVNDLVWEFFSRHPLP